MKQKTKNKANTIKFLVIGDLHGNKPKIHQKEFDAIICPGDIFGDDIRPYFIKLFKKIKETKNQELTLDDICPKYKQKYYKFTSKRKGQKVLKFLNSLNKPVFLVPGNWESNEELNKAIKNKKNIQNIQNKKTNFKGITLIGHGSTSSPEPLDKPLKKEFEDTQNYKNALKIHKKFTKTYKKLNNYFKQTKNSNKIKKTQTITPSILLSHNAPYKTKLDKINSPGSYVHNKHYGSIIARNLIETHQPTLCVAGHIHEGYGKTRLRKTVCINAGFGSDVNTIVDIDVNKNKITTLEFLGKNKEN